MSTGIGAKSTLSFAEEATYGVFPAAATGIILSLISESLQNTRNAVTSPAVDPSRRLTAIRGGNISAGGNISLQLTPSAIGKFLKHTLLPSAYAPEAVVPTALTNSLAVTRGSHYTSGGRIYLCTRAGISAADAATTGALTSVDNAAEEQNGTAYFQYFAATGTPLYKHTFNAGAGVQAGGLSFERMAFLSSGSRYFRYVGGRINSLGLTIPQEGIITANLDVPLLKLESEGPASGFAGTTTLVDDPFSGLQTILRLKPAGGSYAEDASIDGASLNISNNYDTSLYGLGSAYRQDIVEQNRSVTGSFSARFTDITKFNYYKNESVIGLELSMNHLGMYMQFECPSVKLSGGSPTPTISGNGVLKQSFDFTAFSSSGSELIVTIVNGTSTYV